MRKTTRAALAIGLALAGLVGLVVPSRGQDPAVKRAADAGAVAKAPTAAVIATINLETVFKGCDKFLASEEMIEVDAKARQAQLMKIANDGNAATEKLKKLKPGSLDQKKLEDEITSLQAQFEAGRKQAQNEIARKHGEVMAATINEVREMAAAVAKQRGYSMVVQASSTPASMAQPDTIEMALSRAIVYTDNRTDISADVVKYLNYYNEKANGPKPTKAPKADDPAAAPAAAAAPAENRVR